MLRRLTVFLLLTLLCAACAAAEGARPASPTDLAVVSQWDERFDTHPYRYKAVAFRNNGCGPSSFANALIAATGVTDDDLAADVTLDMLRLLTSPREPSDAKAIITTGRLAYLNAAPDQRNPETSDYPGIDRALIEYGGRIFYSNDFVTPETIAEAVDTPLEHPRVIIGRFTHDHRASTLAQLAHLLYQAGYHDSTITLGYVGAGTNSTSGPLRSGRVGHYLCLHIPVGEFYETGAVYVLDSLPRALAGEPYSYNHVYHSPYAFVEGQKGRSNLKAFLNTYEAERVKTTIIRLKPYGSALERLNAALTSAAPTELVDIHTAQLKTISAYGISHAFVSLYPPQN